MVRVGGGVNSEYSDQSAPHVPPHVCVGGGGGGVCADSHQIEQWITVRETALKRLLTTETSHYTTPAQFPVHWFAHDSHAIQATVLPQCHGDASRILSLLMVLRRVSLQLVESIFAWREAQRDPGVPFLWQNENYLTTIAYALIPVGYMHAIVRNTDAMFGEGVRVQSRLGSTTCGAVCSARSAL